MEPVLTNARVVLRDAVVDGTVVLRDELIAAVDQRRHAGGLDMAGDLLLPGLVDVHTDHLERHLRPRLTVRWPDKLAALVAHDRQCVGAGITTVCDSLSVGEYHDGQGRRDMLLASAEALAAAQGTGALKADHWLHARCELPDPALAELLAGLAEHPRLRLLSLMDHTPGERQWRDVETYRAYKRAELPTDEAFHGWMETRRAQRTQHGPTNRRAVLDLARARGIPLATHDDTTLDDVQQALADGIAISEFPTTLEAARAAHAAGMATVAGSPNVVLGKSHSGNVAVSALADAGVLDALASDYVPASLLGACFRLAERGIGLPRAVALASATPARLLGFTDRGVIAVGLRADLVRVRMVAGTPVPMQVWVAGHRVG
jgi:alpha-D-ribose 1-methylphosphonate 5-triphosphate diphosphatase